MRTTLNLDDDLARAAKQKAAAEGRTLTSLIEQALREVLLVEAVPVPQTSQLPVFHGDGPAPGIDLSDPRALRDAMYEEEDASYRASALLSRD
jgi:hypothetical protein